jgi:hypothetical protein
MKAALMVAAGWMLSGAVLQGAEGEFNDIVRAISDQLHARPLHIPFFGLLNLATFAAHPAGVKHIDLAVFENPDVNDNSARDVAEAIRRSAQRSWRPFLKVRSRNHGHQETVLVYIADDGVNCRLLVTTIEPGEATVVEVKLNPEGLSELCGDRRLGGLLPVSQTLGQ